MSYFISAEEFRLRVAVSGDGACTSLLLRAAHDAVVDDRGALFDPRSSSAFVRGASRLLPMIFCRLSCPCLMKHCLETIVDSRHRSTADTMSMGNRSNVITSLLLIISWVQR